MSLDAEIVALNNIWAAEHNYRIWSLLDRDYAQDIARGDLSGRHERRRYWLEDAARAPEDVAFYLNDWRMKRHAGKKRAVLRIITRWYTAHRLAALAPYRALFTAETT